MFSIFCYHSNSGQKNDNVTKVYLERNMFWNKANERKRLIEYAEQEAKILAAFQIDCRVALEKSRDSLLNILLGGAGGGLALAISLYEKEAASWLIIGTFVTSVYLFLLSALMIIGF